jgi:hypothetical protein
MLNDTIANQLAALGGLIPAREGAFAPLSSEDIAEIEGLFGHALPADYRAFVSEYGRGAFANLVRCNITASRFVYLGIFYGSGQDVISPTHFKWAVKMLCYRMPPTLMPIVDTAGGEGQICLGLSGEEYGKVYFWDRAEGWEGEADDYRRQGKTYPEHLKFQNVTLLAESFEQFVLSLVVEEE